MAGRFRAGFLIEGDASDAISAINKLAEAINKLNILLEKIVGTSADMGAKTQQAGRQAATGWDKARKSADKYASSLNKLRIGPGGIIGALPPPGQKFRKVVTPSGPIGPTHGVFHMGGPGQPLLPGPVQKDASNFLNKVIKIKDSVKDASKKMLSLAGNVATFGVKALKAARPVVSWFGTNIPNAMIKSGKIIKTLSNGFLNLNNALRLAGQGLTNIGRSWFFFISLPVAAFLGKAGGAAIEFEDALVRVSKTTGLIGEDLEYLREKLRQLSTVSATSQEELAKIAEVIGQMGQFVGKEGAESIAALTSTMEMLMVSTDMTAEEVTSGMGKIMNAFQKDMKTSSDWVYRLANVINRLENDTASTAREIINAMEDFAQSGKILNFTARDAAALSATMISMGMTAEEAGTALRNLSSYLIDHADRVADVMNMYESEEDVLNAVNESALEVWLNVAQAASEASEAGERAQALQALVEIGSRRGGRALQSMASNVDLVRKNLALARQEWEEHNSLLIEYNRALSSTKSHLQLLRNNVNDVAVTVGDTLLPMINEAVEIVVPMIKYFSKWFKQLDKSTQLMYVGIAALVVIGGPALMFLGQIFHAITLIGMTIGMLGRSIGGIIMGLGKILSVGAGVIGFIFSWQGAIVAAVVIIIAKFSSLGEMIGDFFSDLADKAGGWAESLAKTFGEGLLGRGLQYIARALQAIANLIASFFQGHSPPEKGPLSTIDKWGSEIIKTYLLGFKRADFSILERVGAIMEEILTRGVSDEAMPGALENLAKARVQLAELIDKFNVTGIIDIDLLNKATAGLGDMKDEVQELVKTWLNYNKIQEKLGEIEDRRKDIKDAYKEEIKAIGASNMTIQEKIAAIRQSKRTRDDQLSGLDEEEERLERQEKLMKEQLNIQQSMVDTMNEQAGIFERIASALESLKEAGGGAGGGGAGDGWDIEESFEEAQKAIDGAAESIDSLIERLERGQTKAQGFFDAMSGKPSMFANLYPGTAEAMGMTDVVEGYTNMYDIGLKIAGVRDKLQGVVDTLQDISDSFKSLVEDIGKIAENFKNAGDDIEKTDFGKGFEEAKTTLGELLTGDEEEQLQRLEENLPVLEQLANILGLLEGIELPKINLGEVFGFTAGVIVGLPGTAVELLKLGILNFINNALEKVKEEIAKGKWVIDNIVLPIVSAFNEGITNAENWWNEQGGIDGIMKTVGGWIYDGLFKGLEEKVENIVDDIEEKVVDPFVNGIKDLLGISSASTVLFDIGLDTLQGFIDGIEEKVQPLLDLVEAFLTGDTDSLLSWFQDNTILDDIMQAGRDLIQGFLDGLAEKWESVVAWLSEQIQKLPDWLKNALGINSPSKKTYPIGVGIAEGVLLGMEEKFSTVDKVFGKAFSLPHLSSISIPNVDLAGVYGGALIEVNIYDPTVRDDSDLERLADLVSQRISDKFYHQNNYGGAPAY